MHQTWLRRHASRSLHVALLSLTSALGRFCWSGAEDCFVSLYVLWLVVAVAVLWHVVVAYLGEVSVDLLHQVSSSFFAFLFLASDAIRTCYCSMWNPQIAAFNTNDFSWAPFPASLLVYCISKNVLRVRFHLNRCHPTFVSVLGLFLELALWLQEWQICYVLKDVARNTRRCPSTHPATVRNLFRHCPGRPSFGFPSCEDISLASRPIPCASEFQQEQGPQRFHVLRLDQRILCRSVHDEHPL